MRIAFYAPLKSPAHAVPSGDRRVGRLFMDALTRAGHEVELASTLRTYEPIGDFARQNSLRAEGREVARSLVAKWSGSCGGRPDIWFTYHVYHKAPDWLGPIVSAELGIPYVIAEASYAPKRADGPWAMGHAAAADAVRSAVLVICPIRHDMPCLAPLIQAPNRMLLLPPFLDPEPYLLANQARSAHRERLSTEHDLDPKVPWIVVAAMMRPGDKLNSYLELAASLRRLADIPWQLVVVGDGEGRAQVKGALEGAVPGRSRFLGRREPGEVAGIYAASDLYIWPAVNEAYGMALLEAQAAGVPVVSKAVRGVPDVVRDGYTGLLALPGDDDALAVLSRELLIDEPRRVAMSREALRFVSEDRSVTSAAASLHEALMDRCGRAASRPVAAR